MEKTQSAFAQTVPMAPMSLSPREKGNQKEFAKIPIPVRVINLDAHADRFERVQTMIKTYGFANPVKRLVAIDGRKLSDDEKSRVVTLRARGEIEFGRELHQGLPSWGAIGCTLSHKKAWEECIEKNTPMLILEDDAIFMGSVATWIERFLECLKCMQEWDICMLQGVRGKSLNENMNQIDAPWPSGKAFMGTHAYIVTPKAAQLLQKYVLPINEQTDFYIQSIAHFHGLRIAGPTRKMARQLIHRSSIQNSCLKCSVPSSSHIYALLAAAVIVGFTLRMVGERLGSNVK
jgi:glycosyl transferase family 25